MQKTALVIMAAGIGKSFWKRNQEACTGGTMWRDYYGLFHPRCAGSRFNKKCLLSVKIWKKSFAE